MVAAGQALVITQFGDPVRVLTKPGLVFKWPAPVQAAVPVDMRVRTTSSGMHDLGTRDGLRVLVQAYQGDPQLYLLVRSLDALTSIVNANTRIVLRTDAAPFNVLIGIPPALNENGTTPAAPPDSGLRSGLTQTDPRP